MNMLSQFTQPTVLQAIGHRRLARFLAPFEHDLLVANLTLPSPEPETDEYLNSLARIFASPTRLPERLRDALLALERVAAPESRNALDAAIARHLPCASLPLAPSADRALELWFFSPQTLLALQPDQQTSGQVQPGATPATLDTPSPRGQTNEDPPSTLSPPPINPSIQESINPSPPPPPVVHLPSTPLPTAEQPPSNPPIHQSISPSSPLVPWPEPVDGKLLLDELVRTVSRFVVMLKFTPEAVALWTLHTYAWELRDVAAYLGIQSPQRRCGKSTLLAVLSALVSRPEVAAHISSPAFFRVIQEVRPTLFIDETEKVLLKNELLRGILNAGYYQPMAYVWRVAPQSADHSTPEHPAPASNSPSPDAPLPSHASGRPVRFSCWCPKAMAQIGPFPDTLADRCILIPMQRKTPAEKCERLRNLDPTELKRKCARFVLDHRLAIATARPQIPDTLNDRAADIWEPLLILADLAGGDWPQKARQAAVALTDGAQENSLLGSLLLDIFVTFLELETHRIFSRDLVLRLNQLPDRPWRELTRGKELTEISLARHLRGFGIHPRTLWIGPAAAKGYLHDDFLDPARRYVTKADWEALKAEFALPQPPPQSEPTQPPAQPAQPPPA